jgi:acetyl/propionyl-CoA carboxylase alpha subunit
MIKKVLIANRGEIALRIQKAADKLGLKSVITVSDADKETLFARNAQEIAYLDGHNAKDTYLSIDKILKAAKDHECNAVHPGYGFLSEQANFVEAVENAGLIFIGPSADSMRALGDKLAAKALAVQNRVPCLQAIPDNSSEERLLKSLKGQKFPLLIKAAAGGGGRGMRIVRTKEELMPSLELARSEALKFFSDGRVYLERFLEKPRHVEVQVIGDNFGNIFHLGTRDCSTQRRHQKLIEEAPAPNIKPKVREKIHAAAVALAKAVNYNSVGTAEFLLQGDEFFFLEMNTRIQVEHPVTEIITGLDLVALQIKVANNEKIPFTQKKVKFKGHAIEYRIYAENPQKDFQPELGVIGQITRPKHKSLREDFGLTTGDKLSPYYDAMLGKVIISGKKREETLKLSKKLLKDYTIESPSTTLDFHRWILQNKAFCKKPVDIGFVKNEYKPININIEILELPDSSCVAIPCKEDGTRAKEKYCRRAYTKEVAENAVRKEVLSKVSTAVLFNDK